MMEAMSSVDEAAHSEGRTRRTRAEQRAETRERLLDAATAVFARRGISGTSVEEIAEAAGYTRGAFYSNFADKDALVLALLDRHVERNIAELTELAERDHTGGLLMQHLTAHSADRSDDRRDAVVLNLELWLYAVRNPETRPRLVELHRMLHATVVRIVQAQADALGLTLPFTADEAARTVNALGDGFAFHTLIDPDLHPPETFANTLADLQRAVIAQARAEQPG
jgi:AcrR family transcriptional regulator